MTKRRQNPITVDKWLDTHMELIYGRRIRIIDSKTNKGVGDMLMLYMDRLVVSVKITTQFVFIFI